MGDPPRPACPLRPTPARWRRMKTRLPNRPGPASPSSPRSCPRALRERSSRRRPGPSSTRSCPRSSIAPSGASRSGERLCPIPTFNSQMPEISRSRPAGALFGRGRADSHHRTSQVRSGLGLTSPFQPRLAERSPMLASLPPAVQARRTLSATVRVHAQTVQPTPRCAKPRLERRLSDLANLSPPARGGRGPPRSQQDGRGPEPALDHIPTGRRNASPDAKMRHNRTGCRISRYGPKRLNSRVFAFRQDTRMHRNRTGAVGPAIRMSYAHAIASAALVRNRGC